MHFETLESRQLLAAPPLVAITEPDPDAFEVGGTKAAFRITRTGDTAEPLRVALKVSGTARAGKDYKELPEAIVIPAGKSRIAIPVRARSDSRAEKTETVVVMLRERASYAIDTARAKANVRIEDGRERTTPIGAPRIDVSRRHLDFAAVEGRRGPQRVRDTFVIRNTGEFNSVLDPQLTVEANFPVTLDGRFTPIVRSTLPADNEVGVVIDTSKLTAGVYEGQVLIRDSSARPQTKEVVTFRLVVHPNKFSGEFRGHYRPTGGPAVVLTGRANARLEENGRVLAGTLRIEMPKLPAGLSSFDREFLMALPGKYPLYGSEQEFTVGDGSDDFGIPFVARTTGGCIAFSGRWSVELPPAVGTASGTFIFKPVQFETGPYTGLALAPVC